MLEVIHRKPAIVLNKINSIPVESIEGDIELKHVKFTYTERENFTLDDVSICFQKGKTTAIVGGPKSGKSTIVKLIQRFYDPFQGTITADSCDLRDLNLKQYRDRVGYLGKEPCFTSESIRLNMLNSNPDATVNDIWEALLYVNAYEFVLKLPNRLETKISDLSDELSKGQIQKLALARILLRNPDVLIIDEATSNLSTECEKDLQNAIDKIKKNIIKIVISRRLLSIIDADKIVVMDNGRILDQGSHLQLLIYCDVYKDLYELQETQIKQQSNRNKLIRKGITKRRLLYSREESSGSSNDQKSSEESEVNSKSKAKLNQFICSYTNKLHQNSSNRESESESYTRGDIISKILTEGRFKWVTLFIFSCIGVALAGVCQILSLIPFQYMMISLQIDSHDDIRNNLGQICGFII
jgi:ABC-type glutathione transport system ATPase component